MTDYSSVVVIRYDGTDITSKVLFSSATFEWQMAAMPGTFSFTVTDQDRTLEFITGKSITLDLDGQRAWGGYLTQATRTFAFPVDRTANLSTVKTRQWILQGVDYNILFDKRILFDRVGGDYVHHLPFIAPTMSFGEAIRTLVIDKYSTIGSDGIDYTTYVDDVTSIQQFNQQYDYLNLLTADQLNAPWTLQQQGSTIRKQMDNFAAFGAIYYINAEKKLHFHSFENIGAPWGFSDKPNYLALGGPGLATVGMREFEVTEDASQISNDVFVWGGSPIATNPDGSQGALVAGHATNAGSISTHGRWQWSETHFDEPNYKLQATLDGRAQTIVNGPETGSSPFDNLSRGLANPVSQISCSWFAGNVPSHQFLIPGQVVTFLLYSLVSASNPVTVNLPLRSVRMTFPDLDSTGQGFVRFDGQFAIQMNDQLWMWKYMKDLSVTQGSTFSPTASQIISSTVGSTLGSYIQLYPNEAPDGVRKVFTLALPYATGSLRVYLNGLQQTVGSAFSETSPVAGTFTFTFAPAIDDVIWVIARVTA